MKKLFTALVMTNIAFVTFAQTEVAPPPPPPMDVIEAPPPPPPPPPPYEYRNKKGYNLSVKSVNGKAIVFVKRKGVIEKVISLSEWKKNKKIFEAKYGKIPPPPPSPIEEVVEFTPPVIKENK